MRILIAQVACKCKLKRWVAGCFGTHYGPIEIADIGERAAERAEQTRCHGGGAAMTPFQYRHRLGLLA